MQARSSSMLGLALAALSLSKQTWFPSPHIHSTHCSTTLHYIRCIKPNSQQVAGRFDAGLVLHQLRCCGVLEVARIAAAGYPTRYLHTEFAARYRELLPELGSGVCRAWQAGLGRARWHLGCWWWWVERGKTAGLHGCVSAGLDRCDESPISCRLLHCPALQIHTTCRPAACWGGCLGCVQAPAGALFGGAVSVPDRTEQAVL